MRFARQEMFTSCELWCLSGRQKWSQLLHWRCHYDRGSTRNL